jgi:hypothetical protein
MRPPIETSEIFAGDTAEFKSGQRSNGSARTRGTAAKAGAPAAAGRARGGCFAG